MPITIVIDDKIFDFIYMDAMRDATLQKAYNGSKKELCDLKNPQVRVIIVEVKRFIDKILSGRYKLQEDYDRAFMSIARKVCQYVSKIPGHSSFSFGNAQKLINMTCKYAFISSYNNAKLRGKFEFCHCPIDRIMLEKVWKDRKLIKTLNNWRRDDFFKSWSQEACDWESLPKRYSTFQDAVRELCKVKYIDSNTNIPVSPLEYDYCEW